MRILRPMCASPSRLSSPPALQVHKFGGTSVRDPERLRAVALLVKEHATRSRIVVVSSAMAGVTDALVAAARAAADGGGDTGTGDTVVVKWEALLQRHLAVVAALGGPREQALRETVNTHFASLRRLLDALAIVRENIPRIHDSIVILGEKLAVRFIAEALAQEGVSARAMDADTFLDTDDRFGEARVLEGTSQRLTRSALLPLVQEGCIPVVTGFCGRAPSGATTTLGRGGSDLSATLLGAALQADEVVIWTDVDGVYSADPREVKEARVIPQLSYREAAEMSFYGAKVLHQRTLIPVERQRIPVRVKNSFNPGAPGTYLCERSFVGALSAKAVGALRHYGLVSVEGKGMAGVPGVASRLFAALADEDISVTMISQSSSEASICVAIPEAQLSRAEAVLKEAFRGELSRGSIDDISVRPGVGLMAIVGMGMSHAPGVAGRLMATLGKQGINILAIAQGSSEVSISVAIAAAQVSQALRSVHREFGLAHEDIEQVASDRFDVIVFGAGNIGRALVQLVLQRKSYIRERFSMTPHVVAWIDRSGYILNPTGLTEQRLLRALQQKSDKVPIAAMPGASPADALTAIKAALSFRLCRPVLVDVSDADVAADLFLHAFARGCDVVTANKKPLAGDAAVYQRVRAAAQEAGRLLRAEATVGAGLPVIDTLEILLGTGDRVAAIEGCLSGTLGFILSRVESGKSLSSAVREAHGNGYTEPDPVVDLSGIDVARKALILGRISGLVVDAPLAPEGLVDAAWMGLDLETLLARVCTLDDALRRRAAQADAAGEVLRYMARVTQGRVAVGLRSVPKTSAAGRLSSSENLVVFRSSQYDAVPLMVTGPGAGVDVTAMGVLGDILRVAAERGEA